MPRNFLLLFVICLATAGCVNLGRMAPQSEATPASAPVRPHSATEPSPDEAAWRDVAWLLDYYHQITLQSRVSLEKDFRQARREMDDHPSPRHQLRLAMLVATPGTRYHDHTQATSWLQDIIKDEQQNSTLRDFAFILYNSLDRQQKIRAKLGTLNARIKDLQSNNQTLQEQLDALKAIEKSFYERDKIEDTTKK